MNNIFKGIVGVALLSVLAGCTPADQDSSSDQDNGQDSGEKVTIKVWDYLDVSPPSGEVMDEMIQKYESQNPNVEIERTFIPFADLNARLLSSSAADDLPDIVLVDNPNHQSFAAASIFADITEFVDEWDISDNFYDGPWSSTLWEGKNYGVPNSSNALVLWYNQDLLEENGFSEPPKTWADVKDYAEVISDQDGPYTMAISSVASEEGTFQFLPYLWQAGADLDKLDSPEALEAFEYIQNLVKNGQMSEEILNWTQQDVAMQFSQSNAAMMVNGPWTLTTVNDNADFEWAIAPLPENDGAASVLGGENWAITNSSEVKEEAFDFIKWTHDEEVHLDFLKQTGRLPSRGDLAEDEYFVDDPILSVYTEQLQSARARAYGSEYPQISSVIQEAFQQAILGADMQPILEEAAADVEPFLP